MSKTKFVILWCLGTVIGNALGLTIGILLYKAYML